MCPSLDFTRHMAHFSWKSDAPGREKCDFRPPGGGFPPPGGISASRGDFGLPGVGTPREAWGGSTEPPRSRPEASPEASGVPCTSPPGDAYERKITKPYIYYAEKKLLRRPMHECNLCNK